MINQALNLDEAMQLVSEAFLPCGCVTSANPDEDSFGFTVMSALDDDTGIPETPPNY